MNDDWLTQYPRAAAMLQGDDDVLLYEPRSAHGLEAPRWAGEELALDLDLALDRGSGPPPRRTLLEPHWRLHDQVRHRLSQPLRLTSVEDLPPVPEPLPHCDTVLDARMWSPAGQPCPCGQERWVQEPPGSPAPDEEEIDRGDW